MLVPRKDTPHIGVLRMIVVFLTILAVEILILVFLGVERKIQGKYQKRYFCLKNIDFEQFFGKFWLLGIFRVHFRGLQQSYVA